ncbi:hypothetical protein CR162_17680 [Pseudoroseomonas rhizosphaerae]|uniref:Uncharacterized protein n=1 Tax=Teichococcus rhizosphaerae TaxID=1335062 RepID=A0A2C7A5I9_9PROT|nr:hypothetical protein [Pseudoroseomonas rhizosphaerae]PHK93610.1 hypothetical protein CR162_17680 [Pseudoroseomonas rhizosphaerae]
MSPERRLAAPRAALALAALLPFLPASPAAAQLRSLAVPAEAGVVVPPRGQPMPRLVAPPAMPAALPAEEPPAPVQLPPGGQGLAAPLMGAALPMAAAALLGVGLGGGGQSGGAPARTR